MYHTETSRNPKRNYANHYLRTLVVMLIPSLATLQEYKNKISFIIYLKAKIDKVKKLTAGLD